jgi:hypothetical protein
MAFNALLSQSAGSSKRHRHETSPVALQVIEIAETRAIVVAWMRAVKEAVVFAICSRHRLDRGAPFALAALLTLSGLPHAMLAGLQEIEPRSSQGDSWSGRRS